MAFYTPQSELQEALDQLRNYNTNKDPLIDPSQSAVGLYSLYSQEEFEDLISGKPLDREAKKDRGWVTGGTTGGGAITDFGAHALWNFFDTASFGLLDVMDVDDYLWGDDYEDMYARGEFADDSAATWGAGIGGFAGFVAPGGPLKVGGFLSRGLTKLPSVHRTAKLSKALTGTSKVDNLATWSKTTAGLSKKVNISEEAIKANRQLSNRLKEQAVLWKERGTSKWFVKSDDFGAHINKHIDSAVQSNIKSGVWSEATALRIGDIYKKLYNKVPITDFTGLVTKYLPGKFGYGVGSIFDEALMFGTIDALMETVEAGERWGKDEGWSYDWSHPLWGATVGGLFGTLKWLPKGGKSTSSQTDFQQGLRTFLGKAPARAKLKSEKELSKYVESQGNILKAASQHHLVRKGIRVTEKTGTKDYSFKFKGKNYDVDLTNPEGAVLSILKDAGLKNNSENREVLLRSLVNHMDRTIGKKAMGTIFKNSSLNWTNFSENWHRMFLASAFMNARTIHDYSQGRPHDPESTLMHVLLGMYVGRKGIPRRHDFVPEKMREVRWYMDNAGINTQHLYLDMPSFDPRYTEPSINPLAHDHRLLKTTELAEREGLTTSDWSDLNLERHDNWMIKEPENVTLWRNPDKPLFLEFYSYLSGGSGTEKMYTMPLESVSIETARDIVSSLKEQGISNKSQFRDIALKSIEKGNSRLKDAIMAGAIDIRNLNLNGKFLRGNNNVKDVDIGEVSKDFVPSQELLDRARNGEIEGLGSGDEAVAFIHDLVKKAKNISTFAVQLGRAKFNLETVHLEKPEEILNLKNTIEDRENLINKEMKLTKDLVKFRFDAPIMTDFAAVAIVQNFKSTSKEVAKVFDKDSPDYKELLDVLKTSGIIEFNEAKLTQGGHYEIPYNINDIRLHKHEWDAISENTDKAARLRAVLKFTRDIMAAKGGKDFSFTDKGRRYVSLGSVEALAQFLRQRGINTERPEVLRELGEHIQWQIHQEKKAGSSLKENDLVYLSNLTNPSIRRDDKLHPMVSFAGLKGRDVPGWKMDLFDLDHVSVIHSNTPEGEGLYAIAEAHNRLAEKIFERGTTDEGLQLVQRGETIQVVDPANIRAVQAAMDLANIYSSNRAGQTLFEFFNVIEGNSNVRDALASLASQGHEAQFQVLKMLYDFGVIKTIKSSDPATQTEITDAAKGDPQAKEKVAEEAPEVKQSITEYDIIIDREVWSKPENIKRFKDFINNEGINMHSIEEQAQEVHAMLEDIIEMTHVGGQHRKITQVDYFRDYFPKSFNKGSFETPEQRNKWIKEAIFDNGGFRGEKAINDIFKEMEKEGTLNPDHGDIIHDHTMQIISNYIESRPVDVLFYSHGGVHTKKVSNSIYKSDFTELMDRLDMKFGFVEGTSTNWAWNDSYNKPFKQVLDIFKSESDHLSETDKASHKAARKLFEDHLEKHVTDKNEKIAVIPVPGKDKGNRIFVLKKDFGKVQDAFEAFAKEIVSSIDALRVTDKNFVKDKLSHMISEMRNEGIQDGRWRDTHTEALHVLWFHEMLKGKNPEGNVIHHVIDYLKLPKGSPELMNLDTRFNIFSRMKFKQFNKDLLEAQLKSQDYVTKDGISMSRRPEDINILNYYDKLEGPSAVVWNDKPDARGRDTSIKESYDRFVKDNNIRGKNKELLTWDVVADKKDETGFDSIAYISSRFARLLALGHGASAENGQIFKAHVASNGESMMFYGKTVLVHSPDLQTTLFKGNQSLDMVFTHSADKLKVMEKNNNLLDVSWRELSSPGLDVSKYMFQLPFKAIAISKVPDYNTPAKVSPTFGNNDMNSKHNDMIFDSFHKEFFDRARESLDKIVGRPLAENEVIRMIKKMDIANVDEVFNQGGSSGGYGVFLDFVNFSRYATPSALGRDGVLKILKERFIDSALAPESIFIGEGGKKLQFGGKSVLTQHPNSDKYDLAPTVVDYVDGTVKKYGEMMLPSHMKDMPIDFEGRDTHVFMVMENNKIRKAQDVFIELQKKIQEIDGTKENPEDLWRDLTRQDNPLEALHNFFDYIKTNPDIAVSYPGISEYFGQLALSVSRFPRTRPNDLALLRLKGFLEEGGNQMIINKADVYTIFEGDYDVDMADYFWGMNDGMVNHIQKQHRNWVTPPNLDLLSPRPHASLELGSKNATHNMAQWDKFDANKRVLKDLIGTVQSTTGKVNHIADVSETMDIGGKSRKVILHDRTGNKWFVEVDWNNADWFQRQALEAQAIIDFKNGLDPSLLKGGVRKYLDNYLFPKMGEESAVLGEYDSNITKFNENLKQRVNGGGKRIRMFRRWEKVGDEYIERDLTEMDIDILKIQMREYSKVIKMMPGRKIHEAGAQRTPGYNDLMSTASDYFNYAKNIDNSIYNKLAALKNEDGYNKYNRKTDLADYFGVEERENSRAKWLKKNNKEKYEEEKELNVYDWRTGDPFPNRVKANFQDRANVDGTTGSFGERALKDLWVNDALNPEKEMHLLTGKEFRDYEMIEHMMFDGVAPIVELSKAFPKIKKDLSSAKAHLLKLKKQAAKHWWWSKNSSTAKQKERNKEALAAVNKRIRDLENGPLIRSVINKDYLKSRKYKDLGDIEIVDMQSNSDIIDGTVQYYVTAGLFKGIQNKRGLNLSSDSRMESLDNTGIAEGPTNAYKKDLGQAVYDFMKATGTEYSMSNNYAEMYMFGRRSIHNELGFDRLSQELPKEAPEIETDAMKRITSKVVDEEFGFDFLYALARPRADAINNKVSIFNGKVLPVATAPTANYRRALRWLTMASMGRLEIPSEIQALAKVELLKWQKLHYMWANFLGGRKGIGDLPAQDIVEFNMYESGLPEWSYNMGKLFNSYNSVNVGYYKHMRNPFGMGDIYGKKLQFLRSLLSISGIGNDDVNSLSKTFSYTAQLMAENQYMNPIRYYTIMKNIKTDVNAALNSVTPEKGKLPWMNKMSADRINHVINDTDPGAIGFNVHSMYNQRELKLMNKVNQQAEGIRESGKDVWQEIKDQMKVKPKEIC